MPGRGLSGDSSLDFFRFTQEPLNPTTLLTAENRGGPVCPIQTEESHTRCVKQRRGLIELVVAAMRTDDRFPLDVVHVREMLSRGGVEEWFPLAKDSHEGSFLNKLREVDALNVEARTNEGVSDSP
jgi:hypothetical protein